MFVMLGIEKPIEVEVVRSRYLCPISSTHERDHVQLVFVPVASEIAKTSPGLFDRVVLCRGPAGRAAQ